ncbi:galactocerebrosidase [Ferruginibacter sp.]
MSRVINTMIDSHIRKLVGGTLFFIIACAVTSHAQTIIIDGKAAGKRFDGIGAVSGGGATSLLLKDYPEPQRSQVLDLLFKPKFGASMSALLVEVPGDGNSTQGSEPSHMHTKTDENYYRGYEWWIMSEAKKRNPSITLDANGWSAPGWVGNGKFWSQDMCDYYAKWIKGLKKIHGLDLDAIGCRNEKGVSKEFVKIFRTTLNAEGFSNVKIHAFDNWTPDKFNWVKDLLTDSALRASVDIISAHTMSEIPVPADVIKLSDQLNKPIWNSEEHNARKGYEAEINLVEWFNRNYTENGVTKIVNWFLVGSTYAIEPYSENAATMIAREPWSGYYYTKPVIWGYAHYGQFTKAGWNYINGACGKLDKGGTYVTLKSPQNDYSIIAETRLAKESQKISFKIIGGLSGKKLCVWKSNDKEQFIRLADLKPVNGYFELTVEPYSIYSVSTTTGQQKGSFKNIPPSKPFPFPYYETFEQYKDLQQVGYLPSYTADIAGVFELAERSDKKGKCIRQMINEKPQSWAPEWLPYTIIGDSAWNNYDVKANVFIENEGKAGVMGRVTGTGEGFGCKASGYYMLLSDSGEVALYIINMKEKKSAGRLLVKHKATGIAANQWHNIMLRFTNDIIEGFVDDIQVLKITDTTYSHGMAGLITGEVSEKKYTTAQFDDLIIKSATDEKLIPRTTEMKVWPIYKKESK